MPHPKTLTCIGLALAASGLPARAQDYVATQNYVAAQDYVAAHDYVGAQEYVAAGTRQIHGSRCSDLGADFIDMGSGVCGRVGSSSRVQLGTRSAGLNEWSSTATTSATLRSDNLLPGAAVQHLRVRGYAPSTPFQ